MGVRSNDTTSIKDSNTRQGTLIAMLYTVIEHLMTFVADLRNEMMY